MTLLSACPTCQLLFTTWITTCPECERVLERVVEEDGAVSLATITSEAVHGPAPKYQRARRIG